MNDDIVFNNLKKNYNSIILKIIDILDPQNRKKKYNNDYYLKMIFYLLYSVVNWKKLGIINSK